MNVNQNTEQRQSLTQVNLALKHFTDRHDLTMRFAEYLNEEPPPQKILFFYGDGGNGKSLLLKFLLNHHCQHFSADTWQQLKAKSSYEFAAQMRPARTLSRERKQERSLFDSVVQKVKKWLYRVTGRRSETDTLDFQPVPPVLLDFEQQPLDDYRSQDPFYGLLILRNNLVKAAARLEYKLDFPLTDYACLWYLQTKGKLTNELFINERFPSQELFVTGGIVNLFRTLLPVQAGLSLPQNVVIGTLTGLGGALPILAASTLNVVSKRFGKELSLYLRGRGLKPGDFQRINQLDPDKELIDALPNFFAEDLNVAMQRQKAPPKIVLFFDSHEAFWGDGHHQGEARYFKRDEWLRCLLGQLDLSKIVVVVAGREKPRWHEAAQESIPQDKLEFREVKNFQTKDARKYLKNVGILDEQLCEKLINYARYDRLEEDLVHPLLLGLCGDIVRSAYSEGKTIQADDYGLRSESKQKLKILVERLLKYVDEEIGYAIEALSACRAFDWELFFQLGQELKFNPSQASFHRLTNFSFVWTEEQRGQDWYCLHPLVRRLKVEENPPMTQNARVFLERYYRKGGNIAEAIYQAIFQNRSRGVEEWLKVFETANKEENFDLCRTLEQIRKELSF